MSGFNFGQSSATTGGFTFGTPKTSAGAAPATGFGLTTSTPAAGGVGGFSFGTPAQSQAPGSNPQSSGLFSLSTQGGASTQGGFSFSTPAQSGAGPGGFSFGNSTAKLGLNLSATSQPASSGGLILGGSTAQSVQSVQSVQSAQPVQPVQPAQSSGSGFSLGGVLTTQTTAAAPSTGGFSFSGGLGIAPTQAQAQPAAMGGFTLGAPASSQPGGGFTFGAPKVPATTTTAAAAPAASTGGGFSFGSSNTTATSQPASSLSLGGQSTGLTLGSVAPASTVTGAVGQGSGFSFGAKPAAAATTASATQASTIVGSSLFAAPTAASSVPTGFILGAAAATPAATSTVGGLGFTLKPLGNISAISTATTAGTTSGSATGFSLSLKPTGTAAASTVAPLTAATITATPASTASAPPVMTYAQLESLINKWSLELEDQERHFLQQATQVNAWDRMLIENGEKITSLHREVEKVKLDQRRLDQELDFILSQQKELEDLLSPLEESVKEQSGTIYMQNADEERERTYKLAENVDAQLKRMSQDLKEIIEHLNTSSGPADTSDPVRQGFNLQQICKILNAHMDSLQWIDQNSVLLQRRVEEVSKLCDNRRKEQEKSFRITFE
ncbi:nucleoporin 62 like isoform X2 [Lepisosteus oculatus]|uniref:nucleoporin 62 like isoform X2 n=1 Tax=Lepisosteus oculatus TaxID=7918 RepID=UPI003712D44E